MTVDSMTADGENTLTLTVVSVVTLVASVLGYKTSSL